MHVSTPSRLRGQGGSWSSTTRHRTAPPPGWRHVTTVDVLRLARNRGFAGGIAAALDQVTTPYLALVNDDAEPQPGWLDALLAPFAEADGDDLAATTAKLVLPDGTDQQRRWRAPARPVRLRPGTWRS